MKDLRWLRAVTAALLVGMAGALGGLRAESVADLPVAQNPAAGGAMMHYYVVKPKETVYSLANRLGMTTEELYAANPEAREGLKAYQTLWFAIAPAEREQRVVTHRVEKGQTVYGISRLYGLSTDELIAQNPQANDGLRVGDVLTLRLPALQPAEGAVAAAESAAAVIAEAAPAPQAPAADAPATAPAEVPAEEVAPPSIEPDEPIAAAETVNEGGLFAPAEAAVEPPAESVIAVLLPFMLADEKPSKSAQRMTEFFKGMLVAADTLKRDGAPVRIFAFDTGGSAETVRSLLRRPEVMGADIIVAPDDEAQFHAVAEAAQRLPGRGPLVLNSFIVRDTLQNANPHVMQTYIPLARMQQKAAGAMLDNYVATGRRLVLLKRNGGPADQQPFVDALRQEAEARGIPVEELAFAERLRDTDLETIAGDDDLASFAFVIASADQPEANRVLPAIVDYAAEHPLADVMMFGHPKWVTFRGETLENMHNANTVVYNRFFADADDADMKGLDAAFTRWYGTATDKAVPCPGAMGFDTGCFLIEGLRTGTLLPAATDGPGRLQRHHGVQNGYRFVSAGPDAGWVNDLVFLVNYRPAGTIDKLAL